MAQRQKLNTDVAIIGGGPAGCTLAKELSKQGRRVILLEKGGDDDRFLGGGLGVFLRLEKGLHLPLPLKQTEQGDTVIIARCLGGGTLLYAGSACKPDLGYWKEYGIELEQDLIDEAERECWVALPPEEYIGPGTRRVWEAAGDLGLPFEKQYRHVDFSKCRLGCEYCNNGCLRGAKWTAREFAKQAIESGASVLTRTEATEIIVEEGVVGGVRARGRRGERIEIEAKAVACCAGGTHTARLLQRSGFPEAGSWFTGDPTFFTFGFVNEGPTNSAEHNMTVGWHDEENQILFCSMISPKGSWHMQLVQDEHVRGLMKLRHYKRALGVFAKVSDDGTGRIAPNGKISKTFTERDHSRFKYGREVNTRILERAGCDPNDIHHSGLVLGHPGGTVRVGELLDSNLETSVKNLYSCDTGVFPRAPGIPPALTIVVLAKRLARRLETVLSG
jgi:choline dehydrogenase-like flavoprotein